MLLMSTWYDLDHALKEIFYLMSILWIKNKSSGLLCSVLLSIITFVITVLKICYRLTHCTSWVHNILTTVMTNIIAVKSRDHTKPQLIWYILYIDAQDKFSGHAQLLASCNGFQKGSGSVKYQHNFFATNLHSLFVNFRLDLLGNTSVSSNRDKNLNHSFFQVEKIWFALDQLWYDPGKLFKCDQPLPDELDSS